MYTLDAKININHCHLASYNSVVFTSYCSVSHKNGLIILNFRNFSLLLSDDLLSGYTLFLPQLDVQSHPMQSVGDL